MSAIFVKRPPFNNVVKEDKSLSTQPYQLSKQEWWVAPSDIWPCVLRWALFCNNMHFFKNRTALSSMKYIFISWHPTPTKVYIFRKGIDCEIQKSNWKRLRVESERDRVQNMWKFWGKKSHILNFTDDKTAPSLMMPIAYLNSP